jgi:hypothetical protein
VQPDGENLLGTILYLGALPWLLQWLAVAVICYRVSVDSGGHRSHLVLLAATVAIGVGGVWWVGVMMRFRHIGPATVALEVILDNLERPYAVESTEELIMHEVVGPLTCPALLGGPFLLTRWHFVWCLASTAGIIILWSWIGHVLIGNNSQRGKVLRFTLALAGVVFYIVPVVIRSALRILQHTTT